MTTHATSLRLHVGVLAALLVLTAATTWAATLPLGAGHVPLALGIAAAKAALVATWFMRLDRSSRLNRMALVVALVWLALLLTLTLADVTTRTGPVIGAP